MLRTPQGCKLVCLAVVAAAAGLPTTAAAAPGDLDASFASAGIFTGTVQTTFPTEAKAQAVARDSRPPAAGVQQP